MVKFKAIIIYIYKTKPQKKTEMTVGAAVWCNGTKKTANRRKSIFCICGSTI